MVAAGMAEAVVDALEIVEVDHQQRQAIAAVGAPQAGRRLFLESRFVEQTGQGVFFQQRLQLPVHQGDLAALHEDDRRAVVLRQRDGQRHDRGKRQVEQRPALQIPSRREREQRIAAHMTGDAQTGGQLNENGQRQHRGHVDAYFSVRIAHQVVSVEADVPEKGEHDAGILNPQALFQRRPPRKTGRQHIRDGGQQQGAIHAEIDAVVERSQP